MTEFVEPLSMLLTKIARVGAQRAAKSFADLGITPKHVGLLTAVSVLENPSQADLGAWMRVGPSAIVAVVDELVALGAVVRSQDPANRRRMIISSTEKGKNLLTEAVRRTHETDQDLIAELPEQELAAFIATAQRIANRLEAGD